MSQDNRILGEAKISKLLLKFSVPCVMGLLISALYNIVDQIFIGNVLSKRSFIPEPAILRNTISFFRSLKREEQKQVVVAQKRSIRKIADYVKHIYVLASR